MSSNGLSQFFIEVKRRELVGVLALYIVGAWIVLQVAATLFPGWRIPQESIRFVWIGAVLLFPVATVFGWYYDVSTQGVRRTPPVGESHALNRKDYGVLSLLALVSVAVCFGVFREVLNSREASVASELIADIPENSIAVLPFVNMSDDQSNEYFSDGMTEQLLNELARVPSLHVAARTSSFYYKDKDESTQTMGRKLGVRTLLEGSVRKAGKRVRITAQLINAEDGYHLWSDTFDRDLDDIFAVQDEIAKAITRTLKVEFMVKAQKRLARAPTVSAEAYDLYLRALAVRATHAENSVQESGALLEQAVDIAPDFALAYQALAHGYLLQSYSGTLSIDDAVAEAEPLLAKALELQPDLEETYATYGTLYDRLGRFDEANENFEKALDINPNYVNGQIGYGLTLIHQSRLKEAYAAYLRAQAMDPMNATLNFNLGAMLMLMGEYENGIAFVQKAIDIEPGYRMAKAAQTHWMTVYGEVREAIHFGRKVYEDYPDFMPNIGALIRAYLVLGLVDEAKALLADAKQTLPDTSNLDADAVSIWLSEGDDESFNQFAEEGFREVDASVGEPLSVGDRYRTYMYGWSLLNKGENERAAEVLHWAAGGEEAIQATTYDYIFYLKALALSYLRLDRHDEAQALLDRCLELVDGAQSRGWATPTLHVRLAEVYVLKDDVDNAIVNLDIAFEKGWRGLSVIEYGIFWQDLQDHPELNRIKILIYNDLESQRKKLQENSAMAIRAGEN